MNIIFLTCGQHPNLASDISTLGGQFVFWADFCYLGLFPLCRNRKFLMVQMSVNPVGKRKRSIQVTCKSGSKWESLKLPFGVFLKLIRSIYLIVSRLLLHIDQIKVRDIFQIDPMNARVHPFDLISQKVLHRIDRNRSFCRSWPRFGRCVTAGWDFVQVARVNPKPKFKWRPKSGPNWCDIFLPVHPRSEVPQSGFEIFDHDLHLVRFVSLDFRSFWIADV